MIAEEPTWRELADELLEARQARSIAVVAPPDAGKTTLCHYLGDRLGAACRTTLVDCDPGQSVVGPPTTLGLGWMPDPAEPPVALHFVGSTTPVGHFMQMLTAMKRLDDRARQLKAEKVIFDPPGYIDTSAGYEYQYQMIDLLDADYLVALERQDKVLAPLLKNFGRRPRPVVRRLAVSEHVASRSRLARRAFRRERFAAYFDAARAQTFSIEGVGFHGRIPHLDSSEQYRHRLAALCGEEGFVEVLAIVDEVDEHAASMRVTAPPFEAGSITSVAFGHIAINRHGEEL